MSRFGIGARVQDSAGDLATITAKRKGYRQLDYDNKLFARDVWLPKSWLTVAEETAAPTSAETPVDALAPKVGERVRVAKAVGVVGGKIGTVTKIDGRFALVDFPGWTGGHRGRGLFHSSEAGGSQWFVLKDSLIAAPFIVEIGKFYRTRDGKKVGPVKRNPTAAWELGANGETYPFYVDGVSCTAGGRTAADTTIDRHCDLVAEWVEVPVLAVEAVEPEPQLKAGDRVRRVGYPLPYTCPEGFETVITQIDQDRIWYKDAQGGVAASTAGPSVWEIVASDTPAQSFIVARLTPAGQPRPNARPRVHPSLAAAEAEAQRLADRLGDEFAVYKRVSSRTVNAGPVPKGWLEGAFNADLARKWIASGKGTRSANAVPGLAFSWSHSKQGSAFWASQAESLTPLGRAILEKWIAEAEASQPVAA